MKLIRYSLLTLACLAVLYGCAANQQKATVFPKADAPEKADVDKQTDASGSTDENLTPDQEPSQTHFKISEQINTSDDEKPYLVSAPSDITKDEIDDEDSNGSETQPPLDNALDLCGAAQDFWEKGELDNAILALDEAYSLVLDVDTSDNPKLIQQKEDLRFLISKRILEIYSSRIIVLNGDHHAIPVTINDHVQKEIDRLTKGPDRKFFIASYRRSGLFRPFIVKKLRQAGLPESLSWLPLIESGYKTTALSKARALGLWQFISSTGFKFGLKRTMYIDERLDPEKSTMAAIEYLKALHNIFGDWTTVLASYNCGEGRVLRIIRNQNVNYLDNFWDLYQRLPRETSRYVPKFLATLHIVKNLEKYGFDSLKPDSPMQYDTLEINRRVTLKQIADKTGTPLNVLTTLNPELRYKMLPPEPYKLKIPPNKKEILLAKINDIPVSYQPRPSFVYHKVRRGQTLSTIAKRYRTTVGQIARANNIYSHNLIVAGKLLKIPMGRSYRPVYAHASSHKVRKGDSLWNIARRYGTTTKEIQEINNLKTTNLNIGQILKLPGAQNRPAKKGSWKTYSVKNGDSPYKIAVKHNMSLGRLLKINNLSRWSTIYPGQQLNVE